VERVEKLALKAPFELRMIEIARVQIEIVSMHGDGLIFELNNDLDALTFGASGEIQQRMLVETQLRENSVEAGTSRFRHSAIVKRT